MEKQKQDEFVQRAYALASLPEQDRRYYQEQLIHEYLCAVDKDVLPLIVALSVLFFTEGAKDLIGNALRDNALWPDRCVESDRASNS